MSVNLLPEYSEDLSLDQLSSQQYFKAALYTVRRLRWQLVSVTTNVIQCLTNSTLGEAVTITIIGDKVLFHSRSVNEYYWIDGQNRTNAAIFKKAIARTIARKLKTDRTLAAVKNEPLGALIPSKTYQVTPILIYLNVLVFLAMVVAGISPITPNSQNLLTWGGNFRPAVTGGEWWRLFTYMFLHGGIAHLAMNMFALLYIGTYLEPLLGKLRFTAAYIFTGVCAGLLSIIMHSYTVGVGASGAIFGMYGVFLAMLTTNHIEKTVRKTMLRSILFFVVFNLIMGLQGNTDNAAHIGGLLSGIVIGFAYYPGVAKRQPVARQLAITALVAVMVVVLTAMSLPRLSNDLAAYDQKMKRFDTREALAMESYRSFENATRQGIPYTVKDKSIYYWKENIQLLKEVNKLDLPPSARQRNNWLLQYCQLRIEASTLLHKPPTLRTQADTDKIEQDNARIAQILNEIQNG